MQVGDVCTFVRKDSFATLGIIFLGKHNVLHPTKGSYILLVGKQPNFIVQTLLLATVYQAKHAAKRP